MAASWARFNWQFCWLVFSENASQQSSEEDCLHFYTSLLITCLENNAMSGIRSTHRRRHKIGSQCPRLTSMFSSAPRVFTSHIRLSATENLASTQTLPPLQYITTLPQRQHSTLLFSKGYPSAPEPNSSHVLQERSARLLCASPEKAPTSPHRAKKCYKLLREPDAEGFLLTPDRYRSGFELRLPDTLGDGGGKYYCFETCCVASCFAIMWYWIFIRRSLPLWQRGDILYATAICI